MLLDGKPVSFKSPAEALRHGVTMVFQETSLVPSMTVAQNLYLGDEKLFNRLRGIYIAAQTFLNSMNFSVDPWATVSTLGAAKKQMVEIARAVRQNAQGYHFRRAHGVAHSGRKILLLLADEESEETRSVDRLHFACLGGGAAKRRPHQHSARRRAGRHRRCLEFRPRQDHSRHGRPDVEQRALQSESDAKALLAGPAPRCSASKICRWAKSCGTTPSRSMPGKSPVFLA